MRNEARIKRATIKTRELLQDERTKATVKKIVEDERTKTFLVTGSMIGLAAAKAALTERTALAAATAAAAEHRRLSEASGTSRKTKDEHPFTTQPRESESVVQLLPNRGPNAVGPGSSMQQSGSHSCSCGEALPGARRFLLSSPMTAAAQHSECILNVSICRVSIHGDVWIVALHFTVNFRRFKPTTPNVTSLITAQFHRNKKFVVSNSGPGLGYFMGCVEDAFHAMLPFDGNSEGYAVSFSSLDGKARHMWVFFNEKHPALIHKHLDRSLDDAVFWL